MKTKIATPTGVAIYIFLASRPFLVYTISKEMGAKLWNLRYFV